MIEFRTACSGQVGCFFVKKKNGKLRLIIDARNLNRRLRRPPRTVLSSTAAVVEMEVPGDEDMFFSVQDVADCFYQFEVPSELIDLLGMMPVRAGDFGITELDGVDISPNTLIFPCLRVLPMGFSWALHWTQEAHREILKQGGLGDMSREFVDRRPPPDRVADNMGRLVYVDNEVFVGRSKAGSSGVRRIAEEVVTRVGLPLHEIEDDLTCAEVIGLELNGLERKGRLSVTRRWRLRQAVRGMLDRRLVSGREVEVMIGHLTFAMLLNRPALSTFRAVYDFSRKHYHAPHKLWDSARRELKIALGLIILLEVDWSLPWCTTVTCSDATLHGYACHEAEWSPEEVRSTGRWSDRWRFRLGAGLDPRSRALSEMGK